PYYSALTNSVDFSFSNSGFETNSIYKHVGQTNFLQSFSHLTIITGGVSTSSVPTTFTVTINYKRINPVAVLGSPQSWANSITFQSDEVHSKVYPLGGTMGVCLNLGLVNKKMLDVHAQE